MSERRDGETGLQTGGKRERIERLCGRRRHRTVAGGFALAALAGLVLGSVWLPEVALTGEATYHRVDAVDTVIAVGIIGVLASIGVGFLYAVWNGGPLLAFAIPVLPEMLGTVASGGRTVDQDLAILLTAGAAAATLAVYSGGYHQTGTWRPTPYPGIVDGLTLTTPLLALSMGVLLELQAAAGPHVAESLLLAWSLWTPATVLALVGWAACFRAVGETGRTRSGDLVAASLAAVGLTEDDGDHVQYEEDGERDGDRRTVEAGRQQRQVEEGEDDCRPEGDAGDAGFQA